MSTASTSRFEAADPESPAPAPDPPFDPADPSATPDPLQWAPPRGVQSPPDDPAPRVAADDAAEPLPIEAGRPRHRPPQALTAIDKLRDGISLRRDRVAGWVVTLVITALAFGLRFVNLATPAKLVFDETYYAKDAWTLWKFGYERDWPKSANDSIVAGNPDVYTDTASFIVHPPVGKWLIGLGEQLFGMNSFGWRIMPLVFGTLLVFFTIRLGRRLSRSTLVGGIAGLLLTVDGLAFTMSRIALLDIFQATFLVAAVAACVADRDYYRHRLADLLEERGIVDLNGRFGPIVWLRPWRVVAGVMFGLAIGTKWNSVYVLAVMGLLCVWWDIRARNVAGANYHSWLALLVDGIPAIVRMVLVAAAVYLSTWTSWLTTTGGYDRSWGSQHTDLPVVQWLGEGWASLLHYHQDILAFHTGDYINQATHPYNAHPLGWLLMIRPLSVDYVGQIQPGEQGCTAVGETCVQAITAMGTPLLWWLGALALVVSVIWCLGGRDWRFGVPVLAAMATWLPWVINQGLPGSTVRPVFFFYAITIIPFTCIALAQVMGLVLGPRDGPNRRRGAIIVGLAVALVVANFAWLYPVLVDQVMPYQAWYARMWLRSWI
jgi:dolichyl-phosphate-mannose--protein O-mannosyl transferase